MKTVMGLFVHYNELEQAIDMLEEAGFSEEKIGLLAQAEAVEALLEDDRQEAIGEGAAYGAAGGGVLGGLIGLIAGAGTLLVPGIGPALAAGTLLSVLGTTAAGAGIGAAYGSITGALTGWGLAEEHVDLYTDGLEKGGALLTVHTDDPGRIEAAKEIMVEANGMGVAVHELELE
ncbi:MAG TPA: hypothetical protein VF177_14645 [Anaerolineae bacterium]